MSESGGARSAGSLWTNSVGMQFLWVPPGEFLMGGSDSEAGPDEGPTRLVRVQQGFWLGKFPVTQGEWTAVMGANPSRFQGGSTPARRPVESVSFGDCCEFLKRLSEQDGRPHRLPSEAEWEYAARAGTTEPRYGRLDEVAWYVGQSGDETHVVGAKEPNPWGFHDMLGNVWEWVEDSWHPTFEGAPPDGRVREGGDCPQRTLRGGSWDSSAASVRLSYRVGLDPTSRDPDTGLRVALGPDPGGAL